MTKVSSHLKKKRMEVMALINRKIVYYTLLLQKELKNIQKRQRERNSNQTLLFFCKLRLFFIPDIDSALLFLA